MTDNLYIEQLKSGHSYNAYFPDSMFLKKNIKIIQE